MQESKNKLWTYLLPQQNSSASVQTTPRAATWTDGSPARPGDLVRVLPFKAEIPEWMGGRESVLSHFSGQVGTVLKVIEVSGMAILRMSFHGHRSMKPKASITAVPMTALEMVLPAEERIDTGTNVVNLPYISHQGTRGWLGVPLALVRRTGAASCIGEKSKVSDDGKFVYLDEESDAVEFQALMERSGIAIDLATSLIESPNCPIDNMSIAVQVLH